MVSFTLSSNKTYNVLNVLLIPQRWPSTSSSRSSDWRSDKCGDVLVLHKGTSDDIEDCADELKEDLERKFWIHVEIDDEGTLKSRSSIDVDDFVIRPIELKKRTLRYDDCDDVFWDAYWELCEEVSDLHSYIDYSE